MKAFLRTFAATLLALVVLCLVVVVIAAVALGGEDVKIEKGSYLVIDLYGEITEYDPPSGLLGGLLGKSPVTLSAILTSLDLAAADDRIEGVILKLSATNAAGGGMIDEIRGAIREVREAGKKVYGFADSIDRKTYAIAAACDSIFMPPAAYIRFTGMGLTSFHVKRTLDKLDIRPNIHKIKDYKSAAEVLTREDLSDAARENYNWVIDDRWRSAMDVLREDRGLSEEKVVALMEHALFTTDEAVEAGLVDRALYWDQLEERLGGGEDEELRTVDVDAYAQIDPAKVGLGGKKKIAVVHAEGTIAGRKSKVDPALGIVMGHESVVSDLRAALDDDEVAAVVFRVNSGGGEALASDLMSREVERTAASKPVVVSMVDVAASGGYLIAYRASRLVADPSTITGSIGSISGKLNVSGFHEKLGITHDFVEKGPMAFLFSDQRDFTEAEWKRFTENHWEGFNQWLADVADRRGMTFAEAEKLAHGRVWTGTQALGNGLIDAVGGLDRAIDLAKELAGIDPDEKVTVVHLPKKKGLVEAILAGDLDLAAAVRLALYRAVREEVAGVRGAFAEGPLFLADPIELR